MEINILHLHIGELDKLLQTFFSKHPEFEYPENGFDMTYQDPLQVQEYMCEIIDEISTKNKKYKYLYL